MFSDFWLKNSKQKNFEALVLFVESESSDSCPNNCWCNKDICIKDPVVLGKGSFGITYLSTISQVIMKMIITNTKADIDSAEKETKLQIEAERKLPGVVAKIYTGNFCHPKCLSPYQGIYRITIERLGKTFTEVMSQQLQQQTHDFSIGAIRRVLAEMRKAAEAFGLLNSAGYMHGDAHGGNIMQTLDTKSYRIIDFGFARKNFQNFKNIDAFFFIIRTLVDLRKKYRVDLANYPKLLPVAAKLVADFITTIKAKNYYNSWDPRVSSMFLPDYDDCYRNLLNKKIWKILEKNKRIK